MSYLLFVYFTIFFSVLKAGFHSWKGKLSCHKCIRRGKPVSRWGSAHLQMDSHACVCLMLGLPHDLSSRTGTSLYCPRKEWGWGGPAGGWTVNCLASTGIFTHGPPPSMLLTCCSFNAVTSNHTSYSGNDGAGFVFVFWYSQLHLKSRDAKLLYHTLES